MRRAPANREHRGGLQNEQQAKNRVHIAQIISVDTLNGQVTVRPATTSEEFKLQIPLGGFSLRGLNSSWQRYMPQRREYVKIEYGPDGTPEIVAYAAFGEEFDPSGVRQGSRAAPRQSLYATARRLAEANVNDFGLIFRELKEGEWDMRSAGGAEIYGTRNGTLSLAGGGGASLRLIKERQEELHRARLTKFDNDGVELRFGAVKRKLLPTDANESIPKIPNPGAIAGGSIGVASTLREKREIIGFQVAPATPLLRYSDRDVGCVTTELGTPDLAIPSLLPGVTQLVPFPPNPLRARERFYSIDGILPQLAVSVDFLGNAQIEQLPTAPIGISLTASRLFLHANTTTATLAANLPFASVFLGSEGALLSSSGVPGTLGVPQSFVLGTAWAIADSIMNGAKIASHSVVSGGLGVAAGGETVLAATFTALAAALTALIAGPPPITGDALKVAVALLAFATAAATATTTSAAGLGTATGGEAAIAAAITAFTAAGLPTHFLSLKVFGE